MDEGRDRRSDPGGRTPPSLPADAREIPYESFLAERQRIVDARQRAQQRFDQIVSGGAAGALVLSITFLDALAPLPDPNTRPLLLLGWGSLLVSLTSNFISHLLSQRAFDAYLNNFDEAYQNRTIPDHRNTAGSASRWADVISAVAFVGGVFFLAWFSISNLPFAEVG